MIPTEPIGSLPRPPELIEAVAQGDSDDPRFHQLYEDAIRDTIARFEATGSPVIIDPHIETAEDVRDRVFEAAQYIPLAQLGTTDDCGFSPFCDDPSTTRDTAFAKIRARVLGTAVAAEALGAR